LDRQQPGQVDPLPPDLAALVLRTVRAVVHRARLLRRAAPVTGRRTAVAVLHARLLRLLHVHAVVESGREVQAGAGPDHLPGPLSRHGDDTHESLIQTPHLPGPGGRRREPAARFLRGGRWGIPARPVPGGEAPESCLAAELREAVRELLPELPQTI